MTIHRPSTLVFDFGGVLFRWQPLLLIQHVLPDHAPDEAAARRLADTLFQSFVPGSDWSEFDRGRLTLDDLLPRLAQRGGLPQAAVGRLVDAIPAHLEPQAAMVDLLRRLKEAGERLCFLSNMPAPFARHLSRSHAFLGWFDDGVYSCDIGQVKPEPGIYRHCEQALKLEPARTLFIDDHPVNVEQARALGWQALHFKDAASCEAGLQAAGCLGG